MTTSKPSKKSQPNIYTERDLSAMPLWELLGLWVYFCLDEVGCPEPSDYAAAIKAFHDKGAYAVIKELAEAEINK